MNIPKEIIEKRFRLLEGVSCIVRDGTGRGINGAIHVRSTLDCFTDGTYRLNILTNNPALSGCGEHALGFDHSWNILVSSTDLDMCGEPDGYEEPYTIMINNKNIIDVINDIKNSYDSLTLYDML